MSENIEGSVEMDQDETPHRPISVQKRRSTCFRRRSTLQAKEEDGSQNNACDKKQPDTRTVERIQNSAPDDIENKKTEEASFDLRKYIDDLKREREMWKQTLLDRKRQRKTTAKQMSNMQRGEQDLDLSILSETERNFLLIRPNYEHICEKAKKLSVMATETEILNEHVIHLHTRSISRAEKKLYDLTTRIIKLDD